VKNASRPNLRKCPKRGEEIVVLHGISVLRGHVVKASGGRSFAWRRKTPTFYAGTLRRRDEGITWARGWETEGALALRAQALLTQD
jgi:hypothetical protein